MAKTFNLPYITSTTSLFYLYDDDLINKSKAVYLMAGIRPAIFNANLASTKTVLAQSKVFKVGREGLKRV